MFGGYCPTPYRLTGTDQETGWSAAQFSRLCADTIAVARTAPFAVLTINRGGGGVYTLLGWKCRAPEISENLPTIANGTPIGGVTTVVDITFPKAPLREDGTRATLNITDVKLTRWSDPDEVHASHTPNVVTVTQIDDAAIKFTVTVYASWNESELGDYGASLDKRNCDTEAVPYSRIWYQELGSAFGSAYGEQESGLVHARKIAFARALSAASRHEEQLRLASTPHTAHPNFVKKWAQTCAVPVSEDETEYAVRTATASKFAARSGQDLVSLELALSELLGPRYVGITTYTDTDPPGTWPSSYDLGGGVWATTRAKIIVRVVEPATISDPEFSRLMNVQFVRLMDRIVPAWTWFDWAGDSSGFYLDVSRLDYTGL